MSEKDLKACGVSKLGHVQRLKRIIAESRHCHRQLAAANGQGPVPSDEELLPGFGETPVCSTVRTRVPKSFGTFACCGYDSPKLMGLPC